MAGAHQYFCRRFLGAPAVGRVKDLCSAAHCPGSILAQDLYCQITGLSITRHSFTGATITLHREARTSLLAEATAVLRRRAARLDAKSPERPYHLLYALHSQVRFPIPEWYCCQRHLCPRLRTCLLPAILFALVALQQQTASRWNNALGGLQRGAHAAAAAAMLAWARRLQAGNSADAATLHDIEVALGAHYSSPS